MAKTRKKRMSQAKSPYTLQKAIMLFVVAAVMIHAIYNSSGYSWIDWLVYWVKNFSATIDVGIHGLVIGLVGTVLIGAVGYGYKRTIEGLKGFGTFMSVLFLAFLIGIVVLSMLKYQLPFNKHVIAELTLVPISLFLGWGMNTAFLDKKASGRLPTSTGGGDGDGDGDGEEE